MSENQKNDANDHTADEAASAADTGDQAAESQAKPKQDGPKFTEAPSPLDGVTKATKDAWDGMEGKTVSMKVYVGSIIGVIILMMLARCS